jgi:SAM-dependent methyltransferase
MGAISDFVRLWGNNWVTGRWLLPLLEAWGREIGGVVVDVGCGDSPFRRFFPHASSYLRIDLVSLDDDVICGDIRSLPLADDIADTVLLSQVLADLPNPVQALKEVHRVLRPGGKVIVFESMAYPEHDMPDDYYRIMPAGLAWIAMEAGLETDCIERLGGFFTRFTLLCNNYFLSTMSRLPLIGSIVLIGKMAVNLLCYLGDRVLIHPSLASDYLAMLRKPKRDMALEKINRQECGI